MKSRAAFEHTVRKMERQTPKLYFWTFTYRDVHALKTAMGLWNEFLTMLKRKLGFRGVRVLELHEEHGVHFHVITDHRYKIRQILEIGPRYGFGRTDVRRVADVNGNVAYLCKYLSKRRAPCLRRVRLWAAFGDIKRTRVADIVSDSPMIRVLRRKMGLPSPDQVLQGDTTTPKDKKRREKHERPFLQAKLDAVDDYFETFDPLYKQRQARWQESRALALSVLAWGEWPSWLMNESLTEMRLFDLEWLGPDFSYPPNSARLEDYESSTQGFFDCAWRSAVGAGIHEEFAKSLGTIASLKFSSILDLTGHPEGNSLKRFLVRGLERRQRHLLDLIKRRPA